MISQKKFLKAGSRWRITLIFQIYPRISPWVTTPRTRVIGRPTRTEIARTAQGPLVMLKARDSKIKPKVLSCQLPRMENIKSILCKWSKLEWRTRRISSPSWWGYLWNSSFGRASGIALWDGSWLHALSCWRFRSSSPAGSGDTPSESQWCFSLVQHSSVS